MIISNVEQMTPEWFIEKAGLPSASNFDKIITPTGKPSKQAQAYMYGLAGEHLLGAKVETFQSEAMLAGIEKEEQARIYYENIKGVEVQTVGLIYKDERKDRSCSPDGIITDSQGGLEIKCPLLHTHVDYLINGMSTKYIPQVQGAMYITGFEWWDFMSYYPGLEQQLIQRVYRDDAYIKTMDSMLEGFTANLKSTIYSLERPRGE